MSNCRLLAITVIALWTAISNAVTIDISQGQSFHKEILGNQPRWGYWSQGYNTESLYSIRGISQGLCADTYDWKLITGSDADLNVTTLSFLEECLKSSALPVLTVNARGTGDWPPVAGLIAWVYTRNHDVPFLVDLAADWVTYTNQILPNYRTGDTIPGSYQAILDEITWTYPTVKPKLRDPNTPSVPVVKYWEIGNEPTVSIPVVSGGFVAGTTETSSTFNYHDRYRDIAAGMLSADPTIKVGICTVGLDPTSNPYPEQSVLTDMALKVDFIGYHHYDQLQYAWDAQSTTDLENGLNSLFANMHTKYTMQRNTVTAATRNAASMEYLVTEWNPFGFMPSIGEQRHRSTAMALACADTIFNFASDNIRAAHLFGMIKDGTATGGAKWPICYLYEAMYTRLGDTLIYQNQDTANKTRLYATKDSSNGQISVWALNFNNSVSKTAQVDLSNLAGSNLPYIIQRLGGTANGLWEVNSGSTEAVKWQQIQQGKTSNFSFNISMPPASITLLVVNPAAQCEDTNPADVNKDCFVNIKDFAAMAGNWLAD